MASAQEYTDPTLRRLMSETKSPKTPHSENGAARALDLMPYPKYKPSGVEWLGDVPEHWEVRRLKYLVSINDDVLPESTDPDYTIQYVDIGNVDHRRGVYSFESTTFGAAPSRARRIVRHGDTIVSTVRTYLRAIASIRNPASNMIVSTGFAVLRPRSVSFSSGFAYHILNAFGLVEEVVARSVGANYPAISANQIGSIPVATPPLLEQRAIARYLDRETAKIDALIRQKEILVERLEEHRTVLVSRTVTRGLPPDEARKTGFDPHPKLKPSGVEWLGDVPEHWEVKPLGTFGDFFKGSGGTRNDRSTTGVPCIRYGDIYTMYDRHVRTPFGFVLEQVSEGYTQVLYGDVLFAGSGETLDDIGKSVTTLLREHTCCSGDVIVFRPNFGELNPVFSGYALDCAHVSWQKSCMGRGVTVMHIYASGLKHLVIPLPLRQEQEAIGAFLDRETAKIDRATELTRREMELLREYRTRLISDVVTGKVDVRGIAGTNMETAA